MNESRCSEAMWTRALGHPLRVRILRYMVDSHISLRESVTSAVNLSRAWNVGTNTIGYHLGRLHALGVIELVRKVQRRGAFEHQFRLLDPETTRDALWRVGMQRPAPSRASRGADVRHEAKGTVARAVQRLRARRIALGLSQVELSRRVGLHSATVGRIERGQSNPLATILFTLADELDLSFGELVLDDELDAPRPEAGLRVIPPGP